MWEWLRNQIEKLTGARRFAAGAFSLYIAGWLIERSLTLFWEKILEKQAPKALQQVSQLLATDLITGMAVMALLALFVPPLAQFVFDRSAALSRYMELRSKRMGRRDYINAIAREAITLAQEARRIASIGRYDHRSPTMADDARAFMEAEDRRRQELNVERAEAMREFATNSFGRVMFLLGEFSGYGFCKEVSIRDLHITNFHSLNDIGQTLENAAHKARAHLMRDGYPIEPHQSVQPR